VLTESGQASANRVALSMPSIYAAGATARPPAAGIRRLDVGPHPSSTRWATR
jgi:hypothetical protein